MEVNVSLESHLADSLRAVQELLPTELGADLAAYIDSKPPKQIIPYALLQHVSQWSRSKEGRKALGSKSIDPGTLSMIALLAGTTSSPEKNFGDYVPPREPEDIAHDKARERKTITALVNAVFSVFGAGFAAWWGADKTGWKDEYVSSHYAADLFEKLTPRAEGFIRNCGWNHCGGFRGHLIFDMDF